MALKTAIILILLTLLGLLHHRLWRVDGVVNKIGGLEARIDLLNREAALRRVRNEALEADVIDLKEGLEAVEERARRDLGMIKEGETFFQVIEE